MIGVFSPNLLLMFLYTLVAGMMLVSMWSFKRINPVFWYIVFQWIIAIGTFAVADLTLFSDILYCSLFFVALVCFYIGAMVAMSHYRVRRKFHSFFNTNIENDSKIAKYGLSTIVIFAIVVSLLYYYLIGYNLFLDIILGNEIADFKTARLATYSGENYYAPGYVNQFKNVLLPVGLSVICIWLYRQGNKITFYGLTGFSIILCLLALLGTGQRAPFVYFFMIFLFGMSTITRLNLKWLLLAALLIVSLFGMFSVFNERTENMDIMSSIMSFLIRIFVNDQQEGLWGFRYVIELEFAWFSDWLLGILGILPGHSGSPLEHELYSLLHGTNRGTSGMSTVGSTYYNGGFLVFFLVYLSLGWIYASVYNRLLSGRRTVLRGMAYGGLIFILSVFVAGAPVVLINKGLLAFFLLLIIRMVRFNPASGHLE